LDGEATEPIIETLAPLAPSADPETEFAMTALMARTDGLKTLLDRIRDMAGYPLTRIPTVTCLWNCAAEQLTVQLCS